MNIAYLELRYSGGASNSDPDASLGGVMSSQVIRSKTGTGISHITGVTVDDAPGSADGAGTLAFNASTVALTWTPYNGTVGAAIALTGDGKYAIPGSAGYLFVTVDYSALPVANASDTITVASIQNALWDNINRTQAYLGSVEYRCVYVVNTHASQSFYDGKIYIGLAPTGADDLAIALDLAGIGDGVLTGVADQVAAEHEAPSPALSFLSPASLGAALVIGQLDPGKARAVWQKRTVPALTETPTANDHCHLTISIAC